VNSKGTVGLFMHNLAAAGIDPKMVDAVIISHFHVDLVNGLLTADGQPAFPNAEVLVPAAEWKFWSDDGEMSRAPAGRMADLFKNNRRVFEAGLKNRVTTYEWNKELFSRDHHRRDRWPHSRAYFVRARIGFGQSVLAVRRDQPSQSVRTQSRLARFL
jgi:metal-dependent hydrolase (beta-lactamase superfamily II)